MFVKKDTYSFMPYNSDILPRPQTYISFLTGDNARLYKDDTCKKNKEFPQMILLPFFKNSSQLIPDCNTYPKHKTALALMIFYQHWVDTFDDNNLAVRNMLNNIMIKWDTKKKVIKKAYGIDGNKIDNPTIIGVVHTDTFIWVWQGYDHKISESALMHELVHLALRARTGNGDADHEGFKHRGWTSRHTRMIIEAKQTLRAFGL